MGVTRGIAICWETCGAVSETLNVTVPATGTDHYTLGGALGSLDFDVAPGIGASEPGHRLTLFEQATGEPRANQTVRYLDGYPSYGVVVDSTVTDSFGTARVTPAPCSNGTLLMLDRVCGFGTLQFQPLCGRALRTVMLYVPPPVYATASEATDSMYSAGRP